MHVFSPDGSRLSFTYNDHVMHEHCPERDQRNIGVALPMGAVRVKKQHPREYDGSHFCVWSVRRRRHRGPVVMILPGLTKRDGSVSRDT